MKRFWKFLSSTNTPRWSIILGGVLVMAFSLGENHLFFRQYVEYEQVASERQRIVDRVREIEKRSIDFQTYAGAFVSAILEESTELEERRRRLEENILAQDAAVGVSMEIFDSGTSHAVAEYRAGLRNMKNALHASHDVVTLSKFWKAASDLLVVRDVLIKELERQQRQAGV